MRARRRELTEVESISSPFCVPPVLVEHDVTGAETGTQLESRTSCVLISYSSPFCVPPVLVEHDVTVGRPAILLQFGTIEPKAILDPHAGLGETNDPVAVDRPGILGRVVDDGIDAGHG